MPSWLVFGAQVGAIAVCLTFWFTVAGWCVTGMILDLRLSELLVPLWCFLSGDEAVIDRLDGILAARREERDYEPRHALPPEKDRLDPEMEIWLYMSHRPPFF